MKFFIQLAAVTLAAGLTVAPTFAAPPPNDAFANAQLVTVPTGGAVVSGSNLDATWETNEPISHGNEKSVWYRIDPAALGKGIRVTSAGSGFSPVIAVYHGSVATGISALQLVDTESSGQVDFVIPAGSTDAFFLAAGSYGDSGAIQLNFTTFVPPANDAFANAQLVNVPSGGVVVSGSNLGATRESNEPTSHGDKNSVWYRIAPAALGKGIRVTSAGSEFAPRMAVYRGSVATGISALQFVDSESSGQFDFVIPTGSTDAFFLAAGSSGDSGSIQLNFTTFIPLANDAFANAQLVNVPSGGVVVSGSSLGATREASEPNGHGTRKSVWYRIDPAASGKGIRVTSTGSEFSPEMAVYRGSFATEFSALQLVDTENSDQVDFVIPAGSTDAFFLAAGSYDESGAIQLNFTTFTPSANDAFANAQGAAELLVGRYGSDFDG